MNGKWTTITFLLFALTVSLIISCSGDELEPPIAPGNLLGETSDGETIRLFWTVYSTNEIGIELQESVGSEDNFVSIERLPKGSQQVTLSSRISFTDYYYRVRAYNDAGYSGYTNTIHISTAIEPPTAPSNILAEALSENDIRISWIDNSDNETGFEVEESVGNDTSFTQVGRDVFSDSELFLTDRTGLTDYYYRVRAYNAGGFSDYTSVGTARTENVVPARPGSFTAVVEFGAEIQLRWSDRSIMEEGYRIYEQEGGTGGFGLIHVTEPDVDTLLVTGRDQRTEYGYYVEAFNDIGRSAASDTSYIETGSEVWTLELWLRDTTRIYETRTNVLIGGHVVNLRGTPQDGVRVFFGNTPENAGDITPWSWTDVSSGFGFIGNVVFSGTSAGHVELFGSIRDEDQFEISRDTLHIEIVEPE